MARAIIFLPVPETRVRLGRLAQLLRAYPNVRVTLIGAANPSGDADRDRRLSVAGARLCAALLTKAGIESGRLAVMGEGSARPRFAPGAVLASHNDRVILVPSQTIPASSAADLSTRTPSAK